MLNKYLLLFLNIIFSIFLIYGVELHLKTKEPFYLILTIITTNLLIYIIYKMLVNNYSFIEITLTSTIIPFIVLSLISFFVIKEKKPTYIKLLSITLILFCIYFLI